MPRAFIIYIDLRKGATARNHATLTDVFEAAAQIRGFTASRTVVVDGKKRDLPPGMYKVTGSDAIDDLFAVANSAAKSVRRVGDSANPYSVVTFDFTDSPERMRYGPFPSS